MGVNPRRSITTSWRESVAQARRLRQELHHRPETAWAEHATAAAVREILDSIGIHRRDCAGTGTVAMLAPHAPGPHVALRADLDAMPITEETGLPYASAYDGVPTETKEAIPLWIDEREMPYSQMWADDRLWYPLLQQGRRFEGRFLFDGEIMLGCELEIAPPADGAPP